MRNARLFVIVAVLITSSYSFAVRRTSTYHHHARHGRHLYWAPLLRGSHQSLLRQNEEIDRLGLPRIENDAELENLVSAEKLVPIRGTQQVRIDPRLDVNRRFCRPWTLQFLEDFGHAYYHEFGRPIQVNSAVRTVEQQRKLRRRNGNAAPSTGDTASSHLAGLTVDIAKKGMNRKQRKWAEKYLYELQSRGLIEAAEERRQAVFHVMVSERYTAFREEKLATR